MSRVYPNGSRTNSGNYNPIPMWNVGAQMVALNYQTPGNQTKQLGQRTFSLATHCTNDFLGDLILISDSWMEVNCSKFYQNGGSGYVLKPDFLFKSGFDPNDLEALERFNIKGFNLTIRVRSVLIVLKVIVRDHCHDFFHADYRRTSFDL